MLRFRLLIAGVLGAAAVWGVLELTQPPGPGLDPDSLSYLGAGISLARGEGLRVPSASWASADTSSPLVHFPPGFSATIAVGIRMGASPVKAARIVEAVSAGVTVAAVVLVAAAAGGLVAAFVAIAMVAVTPAMMTVHASVLSEPLFLALLTCFVGVLAGDPSKRRTRRTLVLGALAAAAILVRYAGVSLLAVLALEGFIAAPEAALTGRSAGFRVLARARSVAVAVALPVVLLAAWAFTRPRSAEAERIRDAGVYLNGFGATVGEGVTTVAQWLAPSFTPGLATVLVAAGVLAAIITLLVHAARAALRGEASAGEVRVVRGVELMAIAYGMVLVASRLLADPGIPFDARLLAPLFLLASIAIGVLVVSWCRAAAAAGHVRALILTIGIIASWIAGAAQVSGALLDEVRADGADMASAEWRLSPLVDWATHADARTRLYSNWPAAIWFHTGRAALELPTELDSATVAAFRAKLAVENGAVVAFHQRSPDVASPDSLAKLAGLVEVMRSAAGTVWRAHAATDTTGAPPQAAPRISP